MGGGTGVRLPLLHDQNGLSPRGRGNLRFGNGRLNSSRSIPAWAGEPGTDSIEVRNRKVYPRVGGGTPTLPAHGTIHWGLSPRGRGNHPPPTPRATIAGSIPAWAGEPSSAFKSSHWVGVYPRVGGGT